MKTILLTLLALICCGSAKASQDKDALAQLLKSEKDAAKLVNDLRSYAGKSPWDIEITSALAQRLAVKGLTASEIMRSITTSGDMAAALDVNDEKFAEIAWFTAGLLKASAPAPLLYNLESLGVPVFDLLGEMLDRTPGDVRELARNDQLRSRGVYGLLTGNYDRRYHGMAERLATKRKVGDEQH